MMRRTKLFPARDDTPFPDEFNGSCGYFEKVVYIPKCAIIVQLVEISKERYSWG